MSNAERGKVYEDGAVIIRQGEAGCCLYVVQEGTLEIVSERDGVATRLGFAGPGELIGEMAVFERQVRSATVRAHGRARVMTIDKKNFLRRINEDPSLAFRIVQTMSRRIRELNSELAALKRTTGPAADRAATVDHS